MWIRDVDLPVPLIEAHRAGELVLFVGAGASRASPADLPDFRSLARDIAADAQVTVSPHELDHPDVLLGRLLDQHVDVHRLVADRIGVQSSVPNRLHHALRDLALAAPVARIVTTNYDLHLSTTLGDQDVVIEEFAGPALPVGDDFTGLVYLHGYLRQEPRRLIVTDRDFGRAYLRDAWAARFLERMFATYTVLFIGYSHSDVVMRYLARSLSSQRARYILTPEPEAVDWRQLDIEPIGYGLVEDSHEPLIEAIEGWASWARMGLLDHRQRAAQLLASPPSQIPEETSYLEMLIADEQTVPLFAEFARGEEWLAWAATRPELQRQFDPAEQPTDHGRVLASWFTKHYVFAEELTSAALGVVRDAGGRLGPTLWAAIGQQLHAHDEPRPEWLSPWLVLLAEHAPEVAHDFLEFALLACRWPQDRTEALLLFDHLTTPQAVFQPSFGLDGAPSFDVRVRGDSHWLQEGWQKVFVPNIADAALDVLCIVDRHLTYAHRMLVSAGSARLGWDPVSFRRSAVEPHPQDGIGGPVDVLIDAARESLEALLDGVDSRGPAYLEAWTASDVPILRRLAVHGWSHRSDVSATAKITWLLERERLFDHQTHHEAFRLIAEAVPHADTGVADQLVAASVAAPCAEAEEDRHAAYARFNILLWITRHAPELRSAREALDQLRNEHPDFDERPHPDLHTWLESGFVKPQPPMTAEEFHDRIATDPDAALVGLRQYEDRTSHFDRPNWDDALGLLTSTIRANPTDGFAVLDAADELEHDINRAVVRGWATAPLTDQTANAVINRLRQLELSTIADDLARLLAEGGRRDTNPVEWHRLTAARELASDLWTVLETAGREVDVDDWLTRAINHPAGRLAEFWLEAIASEWRDAGDSWLGLPPQFRHELETVLAGQDEKTAMAEVLCASQLRFFFGADRDWCQVHILPLLDWNDPLRARRAWDGFLHWGAPHDQLLEAGLLDHYKATVEHIGQLAEDPRRQLHRHLASIALYSEIEPLPWLRGFIAKADVGDRVAWTDQVAWLLDRLPPETVEHQWQRWMQAFWEDRLRSIPVRMTTDEASAMASWVVHLTSSLAEGVRLATAHPASLNEHGDLLRHLHDERLDQAPAMFAELLEHLLRHTQPPFWLCHQLQKIVGRLRAKLELTGVERIIEQALRLGCIDAPNW